MTTIRCEFRTDDVSIFHINFQGTRFRTTLTAIPELVDLWIADNAFDGCPIAIAAKTFRDGNPAIIQISCSDSECLIYQIYRSVNLPASLLRIFEDGDHTIVGISVRKILDRLAARYGLIVGPNTPTVEIRNLAIPLHGQQVTGWEIPRFGSRVLGTGYKIPAAVKTSRWSRRLLGNGQVLFASLDGYVTFALFNTLMGMADSDSVSHSNSGSDSDSVSHSNSGSDSDSVSHSNSG